MVALKDKCHHKDAKTRSYCRRDGESESPRPRVDRPTSECSVNSVAFHADQRNHNYVNEITQRAITGSSPVVFQYDGATGASNGNLKNDGTLIYAFDALNRPIHINRASGGAVVGHYVYDALNRRIRKTVSNGGLTGNVPNETTDYLWQGWSRRAGISAGGALAGGRLQQVMEESNVGNTPVRQYVWGTYIDECIQLTTYTILGPQSLPAGAYYLLQDLLYRAVALTNSTGAIVEAYDTDAYGNTLIFTAADSSGNWWSDSAVQSAYRANEIIFCGYRYDPETELYYVRNRSYNAALGRWIQRDPLQYINGANTYQFVMSNPAGNTDASGTNFCNDLSEKIDENKKEYKIEMALALWHEYELIFARNNWERAKLVEEIAGEEAQAAIALASLNANQALSDILCNLPPLVCPEPGGIPVEG